MPFYEFCDGHEIILWRGFRATKVQWIIAEEKEIKLIYFFPREVYSSKKHVKEFCQSLGRDCILLVCNLYISITYLLYIKITGMGVGHALF